MELPDLDLNIVHLGWLAIWGVGLIVVAWNAIDSAHDLFAIVVRKRAGDYVREEVVASSYWYVRQDVVNTLVAAFMVATGIVAMFRIEGYSLGLLFSGGLLFTVNKIWNRVDRERVRRILRDGTDESAREPREPREPRELREARETATSLLDERPPREPREPREPRPGLEREPGLSTVELIVPDEKESSK